ncbi:unnamed protein product [Peronospora farinosa]|uniref:DNA-directed RNA polymerase I subunit RPA43 n=1 Tax=Peronospora farinosa TaxID=134698 RepID=A0AAV0TXJ6_9STRA|nr:unnamed protein product [Peronospora farinosa]
MMSSAFLVCKVRHNVSLSPCHATEPRVGIDQDLTEQLMRYSEPLQGVVLSFSNVQLDRPYGAIVNEMPFIHCKVLADALVFQPQVGMQLRGIVNKIGSNHIGMLFAGVFNGSVAEAELPKGFVHNYAQDCWLGEDGSTISVEDEVDVKVLRVHVAGGMIAIEGTMRFANVRVVTPLSVKKIKKATHLNLEAGESITKSNKEKKVKKRKEGEEKKLKNAKEVEVVTVKKTKVVEGEETQVKKAKKTKKVEEFEVKKVYVEEATHTNDKKKNKKRKLVEDVVEKEEEMVVVKPKKHKERDAKKKKHKKGKQD